ncbi:MAG: hypothetical protein SNJ56_06630, partial [Termitinemataceae bacterium]
MNSYIITYPAGFTKLVTSLLYRDITKVTMLFSDESSLAFETPQPIKQLPYARNTFFLLAYAQASTHKAAGEQILAALHRPALKTWLSSIKSTNKHTRFVIRNFLEGTPAPKDPVLHRSLEQYFSKVLQGSPHSEQPDMELQLHGRKNGVSYLALPLDHRKPQPVPAGALPSYTARLLCEAALPQEDDIFLDPFMGSGAILIERSRMKPYNMIFGGDIDPTKVTQLKTLLKGKDWSKKRKTIFPKELDGRRLFQFEDNFITSIVSDPPWGQYDLM